MSKKQNAVPNRNAKAKTPKREKGKKQKRTKNDQEKGCDENEILEFYSRENTSSKQVQSSIWLFFVGAIVLVAAVVWQRFNSESIAYERHASSEGAIRETSSKKTYRKTTLSELFYIGCEKTRLVYCQKGVFDIQDETRSIRALSTPDRQKVLARKGQKLLEVPRTVQMTSIDALRDPRVNRLLRKNPRHPSSGKPLHPKVFLTIYMIFESSRLQTNGSGNDSDVLSPEEELQRAYLDYLPTHQDFLNFHPVSRKARAYNNNEANKVATEPLLPRSLTDDLVDQFFHFFLSEYEALSQVSSDFQNLVPLEAWVTSRLIVNTRSFKSDPLTDSDISNEELESYRPFLQEKDQTQTSFYQQSRESWMVSCMVPLLDALDHDQKPTIGWQYRSSQSAVSKSKSFINFAMDDIAPGSNLLQSYFSSRPDPFVFAHYGFVSPDGLGDRAALLAPYHRLVRDEFESEESSNTTDTDLLKYLAFQDGYEICQCSDHDANRKEFDRVKLKALKAFSSHVDSWVATFPPREKSDEADLDKILSLCRLLAMTHRDYAVRAKEMLETVANAEHPTMYQFRISSDKSNWEALEYRTWHVLERLSTEMRSLVLRSLAAATSPELHSVDTTSDETIEIELRRKLDSREIDPRSWEGTSVSVRLGELEVLDIVCDRAKQKKQILISNKEWMVANGYAVNEEDYVVRVNPCR